MNETGQIRETKINKRGEQINGTERNGTDQIRERKKRK